MQFWEWQKDAPVKLMYSQWDLLVRELGGGVWFWTSLWLVIAFIAYILRQLTFNKRVDHTLVWAAIALTIYFAGSTIRGFLTWMQFFYAGNFWDTNIWVATWPWFGLSVLLNIGGAALCIWMLSTWRWRLMFTLCAVLGALLVPAGLRLLA
jgi:hypothetical protein